MSERPPLFAPGDIWFGGGVINTGGAEPCVVAMDMDDALRIAGERVGRNTPVRVVVTSGPHAS